MKLGLALSGGGIRGVAHAGVLKALEENDIKIDIIGGTSSGSIVAGLYAMGYSPYTIYVLFKRYAKELINKNSIFTLTNIGNFFTNKKMSFQGFYNGDIIEKKINEISYKMGIRKISDITMPLVIPTVEIQTGKEYIFTNNEKMQNKEKNKYITNITIGKAIRASSSFPAVFSPCEYKGYKFVDGGILNNVPVNEIIRQGAHKVLSVNFKADNVDEKSNAMDITMKAVDIMGNKISEENLINSDYTLTIQTDKAGLLEVKKIEDCYKYGYRQTIEKIDEIKKNFFS